MTSFCSTRIWSIIGGYNSIGFFALEPRYLGPDGIVGFRAMVQKLKAAGIQVYLDVVFNHTAEGDQNGPTICFRGLDNATYYRLIAGQPRYYVNDTGCGQYRECLPSLCAAHGSGFPALLGSLYGG